MINVKSLKFDADEKLLEHIEKKVGKVEKFFDNLGDIDVTLSLLPDAENKSVRLQTRFPGEDMVIERHARTFDNVFLETMKIFSCIVFGNLRAKCGKHVGRKTFNGT